MKNMLNYLRENGEARVSRRAPFNEIDAMILARVSYLPLTRTRIGRGETLGDIATRLKRLTTKDFAWKDDEELVQLICESPRFRDLKVERFVLENDETKEKQFAAITIWVKPRLAYLSYLGTDETLYGWKEDFNMVFMDEVPAQAAAVQYLAGFLRRHPFSRAILGGHSKGGNLAIYAAVTASDLKQMRIKKVYNFDGPGLRKKLADRDAGRPVVQKIESFIPQDSLIGRLLEHRERFTVVKSGAKPLLQHDIYTWEVAGRKLVRAEATRRSEFNDRALTKWLEKASEEERKAFIETLFEVLKRSRVGNPMQLALSGVKNVPTLVKAYSGLSKEQQKSVTGMAKKLVKSYYEAWRGKA